MAKTCISIEALYNKFGSALEFCNIKTIQTNDKSKYFDLFTNVGLVCMDGESCNIISNDGDVVVLSNEEGEIDYNFMLTIEEFNVATLGGFKNEKI